MLLVLTLRVNQQQDQRGRHRRSSLLRAVEAAAQPFGCPAIGVRYSPAHLSKKLPPPAIQLAGQELVLQNCSYFSCRGTLAVFTAKEPSPQPQAIQPGRAPSFFNCTKDAG